MQYLPYFLFLHQFADMNSCHVFESPVSYFRMFANEIEKVANESTAFSFHFHSIFYVFLLCFFKLFMFF